MEIQSETETIKKEKEIKTFVNEESVLVNKKVDSKVKEEQLENDKQTSFIEIEDTSQEDFYNFHAGAYFIGCREVHPYNFGKIALVPEFCILVTKNLPFGWLNPSRPLSLESHPNKFQGGCPPPLSGTTL
jgi:hypothetical protein